MVGNEGRVRASPGEWRLRRLVASLASRDAQLSEDRIVFRRFIPPGIRIPLPFVAPVDLSVVAVERPAREVAAAEAWSVNPTANVLRVEFRSGVAEWAVLDRHLEQSLEALGRVDLEVGEPL